MGRRVSHGNRVLLLTLAGGTPAILASAILLWIGADDAAIRWSVFLVLLGFWTAFGFAVRSTVVRPLQTLANMHSALREGDFSFRMRGARTGDPLGELMLEVNTLAETLREQRLGAMEASALLRTVMTEIDAAVFAFDAKQRLRLINRAGERLLAQRAERLLGATADNLALTDCLEGEPAKTIERTFPGHAGRWGVRRSTFRQGGIEHSLLVLSDLSLTLREEERQAWQRLVRVLSHELNNSLAPICSIAASLEERLKRGTLGTDWEEDLTRGLEVITDRSESLSRFMKEYAQLARLPKPQLEPVDLVQLVRGAATLETRTAVDLIDNCAVSILADPTQLQQLLINLIRNAADASLETGGTVQVRWSKGATTVEVFVRDQGKGIANLANLFVPFFTTKPGGSGIGLALSRQIAEAHNGTLTLTNLPGGQGCEARLVLPLVVDGNTS